MLDDEISKMKISVAQAGCTNLQIREPILAISTLVLGRALTLLSWLQPHQPRSVPHATEHKGIMEKKELNRCP